MNRITLNTNSENPNTVSENSDNANQNDKIIYFDGVCGLCNNFVDQIFARDKLHVFRFAALQGLTAKKKLSPKQIQSLESVVYQKGSQVYTRSDAVLRIFYDLGGVTSLMIAFLSIPRPLRDYVYKQIAIRRYAWFGEKEFCRLPNSDEKAYFLD